MKKTFIPKLPNVRARQSALILSISVLALAIFLYVLDTLLLLSAITLGLSGILLACTLFLTLPLYGWIPIYSLRFILLAIPGIVSGMLILLNEPSNVTISAHALRYQSHEIAAKIVLLTVLALSSSAIGWGLAVRNGSKPEKIVVTRGFKIRFIVYAVLAVLAGTLTAKALGPFVWVSAYGTDSQELLLNIGVIPAYAIIGLLGMYSLCLTNEMKSNAYRVAFWLIAFYVLIFSMFLRGMRLEVVAAIVAMYLVRFDVEAIKIKPMRLFFGAVGLYLFVQAWGVYRSLADTGLKLTEAADLAIKGLMSSSSVTTGAIVYQLGTFGDIAATFYNIVGLINDGIMKPLYGWSYLNYIPRTLPEFIYPDRPIGLEWIFQEYGETTGGGIFELSEAFINFGFFGVIIVPGLLTFFFGRLYMRAITHRTHLSFMAYILILSLFFRGIWYQNFTFYKTCLSWLILEAIIMISEPVAQTPPLIRAKVVECT